MSPLRPIIARLWNSAVVWSWAFNGLRLASGLLLLPLLIKLLPTEADFGMYYVFTNLAALAPLIDAGFATSVWRSVCFALGGARDIADQGMSAASTPDAPPNYDLLWRVLRTTRRLYACLALITLATVGALGTVLVGMKIHETSSPRLTWLAWGVALVSIIWEIYASWWATFLHGMNHVVTWARLNVLAYSIKFVLSVALLLCGGGLLSVPVAGLVSGLLQRQLARRSVLRHLARTGVPAPAVTRGESQSLFARMWPNSWRQGLISLSFYLSGNANAFICVSVFGLAANAQYGLSLQLMTIAQGVAQVWTQVKWPQVTTRRARCDLAGVRQTVWSRLWLQILTFVLLAAAAIALGPPLLRWWGSEKTLLPVPWLAAAAAYVLLEMHLSFWMNLIATENRLPFLRPIVAGNVFSLCLALGLVGFTTLETPALILAPLISGGLFNYWYWPLAGARSVRTHWWRFMFAGPRWAAANAGD